MEFQCGDKVVYGIHGVCCILGTEMRSVDRKRVEYYILEPVEQVGARFYVPTQNKAAVSKLRTILTCDELHAMLRSELVRRDVWIPDENQRKLRYRELINSSDRAALLCMVQSLLQHKKQQLAAGRKFHLCDENFLRDAQKLLASEFSLVLGIPPEEVSEYVQKELSR
ncbi:MAG: hypothetical protein IJO56_06005 [Oscillospiraceae bacterium]|nr:hypothetical protein [Oscillospiraceae bacterium]